MELSCLRRSPKPLGDKFFSGALRNILQPKRVNLRKLTRFKGYFEICVALLLGKESRLSIYMQQVHNLLGNCNYDKFPFNLKATRKRIFRVHLLRRSQILWSRSLFLSSRSHQKVSYSNWKECDTCLVNRNATFENFYVATSRQWSFLSLFP